jgi:hypothetical protein
MTRSSGSVYLLNAPSTSAAITVVVNDPAPPVVVTPPPATGSNGGNGSGAVAVVSQVFGSCWPWRSLCGDGASLGARFALLDEHTLWERERYSHSWEVGIIDLDR